jgi:hypothetical protein
VNRTVCRVIRICTVATTAFLLVGTVALPGIGHLLDPGGHPNGAQAGLMLWMGLAIVLAPTSLVLACLEVATCPGPGRGLSVAIILTNLLLSTAVLWFATGIAG